MNLHFETWQSQNIMYIGNMWINIYMLRIEQN
jgi:hypothetical protein